MYIYIYKLINLHLYKLMVQLFVILESPLDPFLVGESDHKLNFIPLENLFFTYDLHVPPAPF